MKAQILRNPFCLLALALVMLEPINAETKSFKSTGADSGSNEDKGYVVIKRSQREVYEDSSEHNRIGKKFGITRQLFGFGPTSAPTQGFEFSYFLDRNSHITIATTDSRWTYSQSASNYDQDEFDHRSLGVHWKHFSGNSFYYKLGIDQRWSRFSTSNVRYFNNTGTVANFAKGSGESTVASIGIGNQWQWEYFTLGCDWIGWSQPIRQTVSNLTINDPSDEYQVRAGNDLSELYFRRGIPHLLRFHLGATF